MLEPSSSEEEDDEVVDAPGYLGPPRQTGQNGSVPGRGPAGDGVPNGRPPTGPGTTGATDKELQGDKDKDAPAVSEDKTLTEAELKVSSAIEEGILRLYRPMCIAQVDFNIASRLTSSPYKLENFA